MAVAAASKESPSKQEYKKRGINKESNGKVAEHIERGLQNKIDVKKSQRISADMLRKNDSNHFKAKVYVDIKLNRTFERNIKRMSQGWKADPQ